jgi:hypothetical protein
MATYLENLTTRRDAIATELAALTNSLAGGKPNAGASGVDHVGYKDGLYRELAELDKLIAAAQESSDGPWEEESLAQVW